MAIATEISERLRAARVAHDHTQEEAARAMGVTVGAVSRWERGQRAPTGLCRKAVERYIAMKP